MTLEPADFDRLRALEVDHAPDGWPTVRMRDISLLLDEVETLRGHVKAAQADSLAALDLVARLRFALGDNGRRMQDELVHHCASLVAALQVAQVALAERRGYCEAWEWKYGRDWDGEDSLVATALPTGGMPHA